MPIYRNVKTGAEFFSPCECKGADIEQVPEEPAAVKAEPEAPKKPTKRSKTK